MSGLTFPSRTKSRAFVTHNNYPVRSVRFLPSQSSVWDEVPEAWEIWRQLLLKFVKLCISLCRELHQLPDFVSNIHGISGQLALFNGITHCRIEGMLIAMFVQSAGSLVRICVATPFLCCWHHHNIALYIGSIAGSCELGSLAEIARWY